jgi:hypothetical protein
MPKSDVGLGNDNNLIVGYNLQHENAEDWTT